VELKLSVIVCAYNEEKSIGPLLQDLVKQRTPPEVDDREIIVVASGCTDGTVKVIRQQMKNCEKIMLIEEQERSGKAEALNKGFKVSSGDYIALVPADVLLAEDAVFHLLTPFGNERVTAVSGRPIQNPSNVSRGFSGYLANMTFRLWARLMAKLNDQGMMAHCSGEFMAIRSDVKTEIPRDCAADDSYIAIAAKRKGLIKFSSKAVCYNLRPSNLTDYVNQRRRWLFGHLQTKDMTGEYPTVLDTIVFSKPGVALQVLAEEVAEKPKDTGYLAGAVMVEAVIYLLSLFDRLFSRRYGVWPVIKSTKFT
jgi:cellulose synthase/poly-beta-1,6-N-acetylglucosamine synthase-like glycosyltransferase